jgi:hypothetical protein
MKIHVIAGVILVASAMPALAKTQTQYYVVMDTVHNCSVVDAKPSGSLKVLKGGLPTEAAAKEALGKMGKQCKGVVQ